MISVILSLTWMLNGAVLPQDTTPPKAPAATPESFSRDKLVAWCIVPFDAKNRSPEDRAQMLKELGIKEFAYDWRAEHIPTFDREVDALNKAGVHLRAFWFPAALTSEARAILDLIDRRKLDCELWVSLGDPAGKTQAEKVANAAKNLEPIAAEAKRLGIKVGLYNHGGWFGEPENQLEILNKLNQPQVGIIYNLHHGHDHLARLPEVLAKIKDRLLCLNLNGMDPSGDKIGRKILQMGQGSEDKKILEIIKASGYKGPIGVLGHTSHDARLTLLDNLHGLEWLLSGAKDPAPKPRTPVPQAVQPKPTPAPRPGSVKIFPAKVGLKLAPLTVECNTSLIQTDQFQVLIASGPKDSPFHWEIFQRPGDGKLAVYLPGSRPDHIETDFQLESGKTYTIAFRLLDQRGEVLVDGKPWGRANLNFRNADSRADQLAVGGLVDGQLPTAGNLNWVRIRRGWHEVANATSEPTTDADTVFVWKKDGSQTTRAPSSNPASFAQYDPKLAKAYLEKARKEGSPARGAVLFQSEKWACVSCHAIETKGGKVGPDLTKVNQCLGPDQVVESLIWPQKEVKPEFKAKAITTSNGRILQGYVVEETKDKLVLKEATTQNNITIAKTDIEETKEIGSLMPAGLFESMAESERVDLLAFLLALGGDQFKSDWMKHSVHGMTVVNTKIAPAPINPADWPNATAFPNRERLYEFYQKQAQLVAGMKPTPGAVSAYPGLDQGLHGHWGNQNEDTWKDGRWNDADLGTVLSGVCRKGTQTIAKAVAVFLGGSDGHTVVYNPETLQFEFAWKGGFVKFSTVRHGFMDGLLPKGPFIEAPPRFSWPQGTQYKGFHRIGDHVAFLLESGGDLWLDSCTSTNGKIERVTAKIEEHPHGKTFGKGPERWPQILETKATQGTGAPYAVDTFEVPFENPWKSPMFFGDLDFLPDGDVLLCSMQGELWRVSGISTNQGKITWRKVASGIHQGLGLKVIDGIPHVLGRDQITKLFDLNADGEYDYHECFANCWPTSPGGHDYICGLERDSSGRFVTASSNLGVMRISSDGKSMKVLATGFRNPDGIGLDRRGNITVPCSEGDWTPTSMICQIREGGFYGYTGPKGDTPPDLPLVYLPRGLDNSSGGQMEITSHSWGPLDGLRVHYSYGACSHFLLLDDEVNGQPQGAFTQLKGDFQSGIHRGRFHPKDGQLYVTGMQGWGTYASKDGCLQRVRYTGGPVHQPKVVKAHNNGIFLEFSEPVDAEAGKRLSSAVVMAWNYRYGPQYGSPEFLPSQPQTKGHEVWKVEAIHQLSNPKQLFLEIPQMQRANQVQVHLEPWAGEAKDLFLTVHNLHPDFQGYAGYKKVDKVIAPHPIIQDIRLAKKVVANPWKHPKAGARTITVQAGANLSYSPNFLKGKPGETIALVFENPDAVPHNWALIQPGTLAQFGDLVNRQISDPDAFARQYIPEQAPIIAYTDVVQPNEKFTIYFNLPQKPGRYPFVCSFPGHWMVMNGIFSIEP